MNPKSTPRSPDATKTAATARPLRRLQALLILPAIGLVWMPGGFLFYLVVLLLVLALAIEIVIQSRIQSSPAIPEMPIHKKPR